MILGQVAQRRMKNKGQRTKVFLRILKYSNGGILEIETRNNKLEMLSVNFKSLLEELDKLLVGLHSPTEYADCFTGGSFEEACMIQNIEACEWLSGALRSLEVRQLDPIYVKKRAVKEKRAELELLNASFVRRASEFLQNGVVFNLGDDAHVKAEEGKPHYVCRIVEMFEAVDETLYFTAQWYYRAQDTIIMKDITPLSCIVEKVNITRLDVNQDAPKTGYIQ